MRTGFPLPDTDASPAPWSPYFSYTGDVQDRPRGSYSVAEVAALPTERIEMMPRSELVEVIRSVRGNHLRPEIRERLSQMDGETLRRLVFLTRRFCRNQQLLAESETSPNVIAAYAG